MSTSSVHHSKQGFVIAIDGPVASGKGTIAPSLAKMLHGYYSYSGAMFRCIGLECIENDINTKNEQGVTELLKNIHVDLTETSVFLNGKDVTQRIKQEDVSMASSDVAVFAEARTAMVELQQRIGNKMVKQGKIVVIEGRDTAYAVFPDAALKIFLTASPEVRAKRRYAQIQSRGELLVDFETVYNDTIFRDKQDSERTISPLAQEPEKKGYFILDSSSMNEKETLHAIMSELQKRKFI